MYKTVRHGESSLQYTILPQNDDGGTNQLKRKQKKKGKTVACFSLTVVLICGVIASAVLVPLLLTTDLKTLPAAFQKFSVSSLHRTHSGNRIVVVAKKPPGWEGTHHSTQENLLTITSTSSTPPNVTAKSTLAATTTTVKVPSTSTTSTASTTIFTAKNSTSSVENAIKTQPTLPSISNGTRRQAAESKRKGITFTSVTESQIQGEIIFDSKSTALKTTTSTTPWYRLQVFEWPINKKQEKLLYSVVGGGILITCSIIIIVIIWMKRRRMRRSRTIVEKISGDGQKADKMTLLTEPPPSEDEQ